MTSKVDKILIKNIPIRKENR